MSSNVDLKIRKSSKAPGKMNTAESKAENGNGGKDIEEAVNTVPGSSRVLYHYKFGYAFVYALASFLLMSVNKIVLTTCKFPSPSVLVVGQIISTLVILHIGKKLKMISYPDFHRDTFMKINPLPVLYLANAVTGLGGTKELSLPMFTAVRRFGILMTMAGEYYVLGIRTSYGVQCSIYIMVAGSFIAALHDVSFNWSGYNLVMLNNFFTAVKGVIIKKKLDTTEFGPYGILYYNALFMFIPAIIISVIIGDMSKAIAYKSWGNSYFLANFLLSCIMGFILVWSVVQSTNYNSPLTTAIVGTMKNISITYIGMFIGGDYVYEFYNFFGINLSVLGSLIYTVIIIKTASSS